MSAAAELIFDDPPGYQLTRSQAAAYHRILEAIDQGESGIVLRAPAGSGKTFLTAVIIEALLHEGLRVAATATSNKAVSVLANKLPFGVSALTIHSLLGLRLDEQENGTYTLIQGGYNRIPEYDVVIIDEASMLDSYLFGEIMQHYGHGVFFLFVGDAAQLPPVADKDRYISPVFQSMRIEHVELREVVRQKEDSVILELATEIREYGERFPIEHLRDFEKQDITIRDTHYFLENWTSGTRILAWRNKTVQKYNTLLHNRFFQNPHEPFCPGERILMHEQHSYIDLYGHKVTLINSAEGTVSFIRPKNHPHYRDIPAWEIGLKMDNEKQATGFFPMDAVNFTKNLQKIWAQWNIEKYHKKNYAEAKNLSGRAWGLKNSFLPLRLAYASTVHKAQGSTFHTAFVDVKDLCGETSDARFNKMLYTAVTRPSDALVLSL